MIYVLAGSQDIYKRWLRKFNVNPDEAKRVVTANDCRFNITDALVITCLGNNNFWGYKEFTDRAKLLNMPIRREACCKNDKPVPLNQVF